MQDLPDTSIESPDFTYTKSRIDSELAGRLMGQVNFDYEVGRRIDRGIDVVLICDVCRMLDVEAVIGFSSFLHSLDLKSGRPITEDFQAQFVAENQDKIMQQVLVLFMFGRGAHDLHPSILITDPKVGPIADLLEDAVVFIPGDVI